MASTEKQIADAALSNQQKSAEATGAGPSSAATGALRWSIDGTGTDSSRTTYFVQARELEQRQPG